MPTETVPHVWLVLTSPVRGRADWRIPVTSVAIKDRLVTTKHATAGTLYRVRPYLVPAGTWAVLVNDDPFNSDDWRPLEGVSGRYAQLDVYPAELFPLDEEGS